MDLLSSVPTTVPAIQQPVAAFATGFRQQRTVMACCQVTGFRTLSVRLNANWVRRTPCGIPYCITDRILYMILCTLANQAAEGTFRITGSCVNKDTVHTILIFCFFTVNSFPNRGTAIATFKAELVDDQVGKSMIKTNSGRRSPVTFAPNFEFR